MRMNRSVFVTHTIVRRLKPRQDVNLSDFSVLHFWQKSERHREFCVSLTNYSILSSRSFLSRMIFSVGLDSARISRANPEAVRTLRLSTATITSPALRPALSTAEPESTE